MSPAQRRSRVQQNGANGCYPSRRAARSLPHHSSTTLRLHEAAAERVPRGPKSDISCLSRGRQLLLLFRCNISSVGWNSVRLVDGDPNRVIC